MRKESRLRRMNLMTSVLMRMGTTKSSGRKANISADADCYSMMDLVWIYEVGRRGQHDLDPL